MLDSINIGIAGMNAYSDALKTISNNVANMNTLGFKSKTSSFSDLVNTGNLAQGTLRSGNYLPFGSGVSYANTLLNFSAGDMKTTSGDLDLAINGRGFLMLTNAKGEKVYVRTGQFELKDGNIVLSGSDMLLQIRSDKGTIVPASTVGLETSAPKASTVVAFSGNLLVDTNASTTATDFVIQNVNVIDSLGGSHALSVAFSAATTTVGGLNQKDVTVKDEKGNVLKTAKISFSATGPVDVTTASMSVDVTAAGGASTTVKLDFSKINGFGTGTSNTAKAAPADGYAVGSLTNVTGNADGTLQINYTNGQKVVLGDIVVADFGNLQELEQLGAGQYHYTGASAPTFGTSAKEGLGTVVTKSLEGSNVNLSNEFGDLILVQRGFQASSQIISTANEMLGHVFELRSQR